MKKFLALILTFLMLATFAGCKDNSSVDTKEATADEIVDEVVEETGVMVDPQQTINISINALAKNDVEYLLKYEEDDNGTKVENTINNISFAAEAGDTAADMFENFGYKNVEIIDMDDEFLGWMEYKMSTVTQDSLETVVYEKVSDELLTTEEMMNKEVTDYSVTFVAKWKSLSDEDYELYGY